MAKPPLQNYLSLILAAICFGSISVFAYYLSILGVSSSQQAFFRMLLTAVYLFIGIGAVLRFRDFMIRREHLIPFIVYGLIGVCAPLFTYITAIAIGTPVVVAVSLAYLYPAITLILARIFLKEALNRIRLVAVPLAVMAAIIVSLPMTVEAKPIPLTGILLSVATGVFLACFMVFGRKWGGQEGYDPIITTFWGYTFGTLWMGVLLLGMHIVVTDLRIVGFELALPPVVWILLFGFALIATAIPYTLTNFGMKHIDASAAAIILLLDPISSIIMGYIFMGQQVAFWQFIGAALILLATVLIAMEPKLLQTGSITNAPTPATISNRTN